MSAHDHHHRFSTVDIIESGGSRLSMLRGVDHVHWTYANITQYPKKSKQGDHDLKEG